MYVTYILYSPKIDKYYSGQTMDLDRRLKEHNRGKTRFSANGMPWQIVYSKICITKSEALKLEKFIKKRGASRFLLDLKSQSG